MVCLTFFPARCNIEYQKLGCFVDKKAGNPSTLALSEMMLNESNKIDWDKWSVWLPDFVCRCANLVYEKNYHVFGVHSYGMYFTLSHFRALLIICYFTFVTLFVNALLYFI